MRLLQGAGAARRMARKEGRRISAPTALETGAARKPDRNMPSALRYLLTRHPALTGVFAVALLMTLFFAAKFLLHAGQFHGHGPDTPPLESWMRPRYVAMSYDLPPEVVATILDIEPPAEPHSRSAPTMAEVAAAKGVDLDVLAERLRIGAAAFHADGAEAR